MLPAGHLCPLTGHAQRPRALSVSLLQREGHLPFIANISATKQALRSRQALKLAAANGVDSQHQRGGNSAANPPITRSIACARSSSFPPVSTSPSLCAADPLVISGGIGVIGVGPIAASRGVRVTGGVAAPAFTCNPNTETAGLILFLGFG